ncbi:MAG: glycosyltransferase [Saprospiraceae bacterium]
MTLLDALHVNNSGGRVLLDYLVEQLHASGQEVFYLLDERVQGSYPYLPAEKVCYKPAGLWNRYRFYRLRRKDFHAVLCFGNVPPPVRLDSSVYTFFHNVLFLDFQGENAWVKRVRFYLKAKVLKAFRSHTDEWWVQTATVKELLVQKLIVSAQSVCILPFFSSISKPSLTVHRERDSFLFVSDANPHKNHRRLLEAFQLVWIHYPKTRLYLTVSHAYPGMVQEIDDLALKGYPVTNLGFISREVLQREYVKRGCLIYPSLRESFGLGLVEAAESNMPVLCAELPYAHAVIDPTATFDPKDPGAIARAVIAFLNNGGSPARLKVKDEIKSMISRLADCKEGTLE